MWLTLQKSRKVVVSNLGERFPADGGKPFLDGRKIVLARLILYEMLY